MINNDFKREEIRNFITRIEYRNGEQLNNASGVIIKTELSAYILTVKHTFKERSNQPLSKIKPVDSNLIKVYDYDKNPIPISEVIFLDNEEVDIALFKIDVNKYKKIRKVEALELYMGEFNFCAIAGYPQSRKDNQSVIIQTSNPDEIEEHKFSIQLKAESPIYSFHKNEMKTLKGLSGGGVFKRGESGKIYFIGIQYAYTDYTVFLKIIDIRRIINDIEMKIEGELPLGKYPFFERLGIDISKLNFESLENSFKLNKDIEKIKKHSDEYKFLLENNRYNKNLENNYNSLKKEMRRLADIYLYHGKVYFDNEDRIRAFNSFTRAMELYPEYKLYFLKDEFKEIPLTEKQKDNRNKSKEENQTSIDSDIMGTILKDNIKANMKEDRSDSLEKSIEELISFLSRKFEVNKKEIIDLWIKLSMVKLDNRKALEAEKILLNVRDKLDDGEKNNTINNLLIKIYERLIAIEDNSIYSFELRVKLEKLLILFKSSNKQYTFIQNMIVQINKERYFDNDCFIEHLASQRQEIKILKNANYRLQLENTECYDKISYQPIFVNELIKRNDIRNYWDIYCKVRFVILTTILIVPIVLWFTIT